MFIFVLSVKLYDLLEIVTQIDNPYNGWEVLKMMFEAKYLVRKLHLSNKLHTIKMEEGSQMTKFFKFIKEFKNTICNNGKESGKCNIDPNHVECTIAKLQGLHSNHHHSRCTTKL